MARWGEFTKSPAGGSRKSFSGRARNSLSASKVSRAGAAAAAPAAAAPAATYRCARPCQFALNLRSVHISCACFAVTACFFAAICGEHVDLGG